MEALSSDEDLTSYEIYRGLDLWCHGSVRDHSGRLKKLKFASFQTTTTSDLSCCRRDAEVGLATSCCCLCLPFQPSSTETTTRDSQAHRPSVSSKTFTVIRRSKRGPLIVNAASIAPSYIHGPNRFVFLISTLCRGPLRVTTIYKPI